MVRMRNFVVGVSALVLVFVSTVSVGAAAAAVSCGQTITTNTVLTADVGPCPGDGIVVGANNITLRLNGRHVLGNADQGASGDFAGIVLQDRTGVTVQGPGTISGFEAGVLISGGSGNIVVRLNIEDNVGSPDLDSADLGDGILILSSARNLLIGNTVRRNGVFAGISVLGFGSDNNVLRGNTVANQFFSAEGLQLGVGIAITPIITFPSPTPGSSIFNNQVIGNRVIANPGTGISTQSSVNQFIRGNIVEANGIRDPNPGNGIGIRALAQATQITNALVEHNIIRNNARRGIQELRDCAWRRGGESSSVT